MYFQVRADGNFFYKMEFAVQERSKMLTTKHLPSKCCFPNKSPQTVKTTGKLENGIPVLLWLEHLPVVILSSVHTAQKQAREPISSARLDKGDLLIR